MAIALRGLHPAVREHAELALTWGEALGLDPVVLSAFRSFENQARLRARWEAGLTTIPANRPGDSSHNFGLGWDSKPQVKTVTLSGRRFDARAVWKIVRELAGFRVPEKDVNHAEVPEWRRFR